MNLKVVPSDLAKTSVPQTWHQPLGEKLHRSKLDDIVVQGYDKENHNRQTKGIWSTLYNPIPKEGNFDLNNLVAETQNLNIQFPTVLGAGTDKVQTKFDKFPRGSVLA